MNLLKDFIIHFGSSFITAFGFTILYNIPRKAIIPASITGAVGWTSYFFLTNYFSVFDFIATIIASFFIAFASQIFARKLKTPVIIFTLPGLIPLVPGGTAYNMMRAFFEGNSDLGFQFATSTFLTAGALALGLSINGAFFQLISSQDIFKRGKKYVP
ncbi:MAG: threonine/serine exporter family protein [Atopostipes suicloacalis]|nr:threonine/serine exporter family protein [Atopostipes suicloacalis]MDN6730766.1 threonine/serine exporter family protein [Atopostipes suicloacalis]